MDVENIEELFSLASAYEADDDYLPTAIAATLEYARRNNEQPEYSVTIEKAKFEPLTDWRLQDPKTLVLDDTYYFIPTYDAYAGIISAHFCQRGQNARNTVITFNYDTLLEDTV